MWQGICCPHELHLLCFTPTFHSYDFSICLFLREAGLISPAPTCVALWDGDNGAPTAHTDPFIPLGLLSTSTFASSQAIRTARPLLKGFSMCLCPEMVKSWKQGNPWDQLMLIPHNTMLLWTQLSQKPQQWRLQPLLLMTGKIIPTAYLDFPCHNLSLILFVLSGMGRFLVAGIIYIPAAATPFTPSYQLNSPTFAVFSCSHVFQVSDILIWILSNQPKGQCPHIAAFSSHCSQLLWRRAELPPATPQPSHTSQHCVCPFFCC